MAIADESVWSVKFSNLNIKNQTQNEMTHNTELLERYPPVPVLVCVDDGFVDDLLQLGVLQVIPYHHLQHLEQLTVGYVAILIHVINPERNCRNKQNKKHARKSNAMLYPCALQTSFMSFFVVVYFGLDQHWMNIGVLNT